MTVKDDKHIIMVSIGRYEIRQDNQINEDDIYQSEDWLLQWVWLPQDGGKQFCKQIKLNQATTCRDGSYKQRQATGGSLSFDKETMQIGIRINNEIPIDPSDGTAYSGELGGIGGMIAATNILWSWFNIQQGTVTHGVDNDAALTNWFGPYEPTTLTPCFHIVKRVRAEIKKSPIT